MKYSEIFYSIQGEGQLVGLPSVFFRTSYCNLRCIWCDTPYTSWQPEDKDISVEDAVVAILAYDCQQVVITGGEPFMQAKELTLLCQQLRQQGQHITIETNGTLFQQVEANLLSISPKLASSSPGTSHHHFQQYHNDGGSTSQC
ncbi:MAG: 7-carboxy-7-deazaguanine synthase QueE [Candidatus Poribacteria bacterium]|nr:7-carboxy-7-deazaguanine synthase QueE [Candidatus Poribacteria bacterium]